MRPVLRSAIPLAFATGKIYRSVKPRAQNLRGLPGQLAIASLPPRENTGQGAYAASGFKQVDDEARDPIGAPSVPLEILHFPFVLFRRFARIERAEILPLPARIFPAGVKTVLTAADFSNHTGSKCNPLSSYSGSRRTGRLNSSATSASPHEKPADRACHWHALPHW